MTASRARRALAAAWIAAVAAAVAASPLVPAAAEAPTGGARWKRVRPPQSPPPTTLGSMAYDARDDRVVLFGGNTCCGGSDQTWTYADGVWTELDLATGPADRHSAGMAYDAARDEVVLFGGMCDCPPWIFGDTWVFDGGQWTERAVDGGPSTRHGVAMAYDAAREEVVLFGGFSGGSIFYGDTWVWDGTTWDLRSERGPQPRRGAAMAYSAQHRQLVLFGGTDHEQDFGDTWRWNGRRWKEIRSDVAPSPRERPTMSRLGDQVVLFGGDVAGEKADDTWIYGRRGWRELDLRRAPSGRSGAVIAWDAADEHAVLFSGSDDGFPYPSDTWLLHR